MDTVAAIRCSRLFKKTYLKYFYFLKIGVLQKQEVATEKSKCSKT